MEHLTLPSVGASFKKWGCCTPILPKALAHFPNFQNKKSKKIWKHAKNWKSRSLSRHEPWLAGDCWSLTSSGPPFLYIATFFFQTPALLFGHMWSTLFHWLQHMPALPKLLLKTSNTHNFWSVVPKIMKFVLTLSLFWDAFGKKI
jgi:hypothetical protein